MTIEDLREETKNICYINMRLQGDDKIFYEYHLRAFSKKIFENNEEVKSIHFGKQDIRGTESICIFNDRHCITYQKHFKNKWELLGFVLGTVQQDFIINELMGVKK